MARTHPDGWRELKPTGTLARQIDTLERLAERLPDSYTIYHGAHWSHLDDQGAQVLGADFAIVNPAGDLLLVDQVPGLIEETPDGLLKRHGPRQRRLAVALGRAADTLRGRLRQFAPEPPAQVTGLLYCPDYTVKSPGSAGLAPEQIVDAGQRDHLVERILALLPERPATPGAGTLHRFLRDQLDLAPDVDAAVGQSQALYTRLAGGLAHWARRIDCQPHRLRVIGTAGSGKTQLALAVLGDAVAAGRRPLYVCYNRPLADHMASLAPEGASVVTYHQLCDRLARAAGRTPDFGQPGAFAALEAFMDQHRPEPGDRHDELIIDEGQDFSPSWRDNLLRLLHPDGRAWWLEDPRQNLYGRPMVDLPGWVILRADTNYRTPRAILDPLADLLGPDAAPRAGSPLAGDPVELLTYASPDELIERTKTAVTRGLGAGFRKDRLALVTYRGREHSRFTGLGQLGPHRLTAFANAYDLFGRPVYSDGDLLIDSVYRFKGRSAPCVLFTEIEFDTLDERARRKLFVGITRATLKLVLVAHEHAAQQLRAHWPTL